MAEDDWRRIRDAYGQAWEQRVDSGVDSHEVLLGALSANGFHDYASAGAVHDLLLRWWDDAVEPQNLGRAWRRSAVELVGNLAGSAWEIVRHLKLEPEADTTWRDPPPGHRMLSQVRRSQDLALRWFFPRAAQTDLSFTAEPAAAAFLDDKLSGSWGSRNDDWDVPVWLRCRSTRGEADVMAGNRLVGSTRVTVKVGEALTDEARRGVFADGRLTLAPTHPTAYLLTCWLPEDALRD